MSERDVVARHIQDAPVTRSMIQGALTPLLATARGNPPWILTHTSVSSFGWVCGGVQAVLDALLAARPDAMTIMMPALSSFHTEPSNWVAPPVPERWWQTIRDEMPAFDAARTPTSGLGRMPELFRTQPGVTRSVHPSCSFAAHGFHAWRLGDDFPLDDAFGMEGPLGLLYREDGHVLMLGTGYSTCTTLHLAESLATFEGKSWQEQGGALLDEDGNREWVRYRALETEVGVDDFDAVGAAFEASSPGDEDLILTRIGAATVRLVSVRALVDFATRWFGENRR